MRPVFDIASQIAAKQHGRVTAQQLLAEGIDRDRIKRWIADGRLRPVHRGVYAVGHRAPSQHGDFVAAVLACGVGAALSHDASGHLLRIRPRRGSVRLEVTVPTTAGRAVPGVIVHRVRALHVLDTATFEGVDATTVPRTLLDLAPRLTRPELTRACHEGWIRHGTTPAMIIACIERNPRKPGASRLRDALGLDVTLSVLEDAFLRFLRRQALPLPRTNIDHAGDKVDCRWPQLGLTVELLSFRYHATRHAFESDVARRRRSNHLAFTYGDVVERPSATAAELARWLRVEN
jgi:hypothetical protein